MNKNSQQLDMIKRQFMDLVNELHARKLAIPAGLLLVGIIGAMILLPKGSTPPPPPTATDAGIEQPEEVRVAQVAVIQGSKVDDEFTPAGSENPFIGQDSSNCTTKQSGTPKILECRIGDLMVSVTCPPNAASGECGKAAKAEGASGSTGKSEGGGATGSTGGTGGGGEKKSSGDSKKNTRTTYYVVTLTLDGRTYTNVLAGDSLPNERNPLTIFAGTTDSNKKAIFLAADGVAVTGVASDEELGNFELAPGKSATLTDAQGVEHKLTLKKITKVTK
jgi:hypothetical protein